MNASVEKKPEDGKPHDGEPRDDESVDEEPEDRGDEPQNGSQRRPDGPLFEGSPVEADSSKSAHDESAGSSSDGSSSGDTDSPRKDFLSEHSSASAGSGEDAPDLFQGNTSLEDASQGPAEPGEEEETKQLNVTIPAALHEQLKIESVRRDTPMKVLVARLLSENL